VSEPFLAEIRIVGFNFAPRGWATCDGQIMPINQNQSLYSLLGTTYGGDGRTSFALPDLRGRVPIHLGAATGATHPLGSKAGEDTHTLSNAEMPEHNHVMQGSNTAGDTANPGGNVLAREQGSPYSSAMSDLQLQASWIGDTGGGQAHQNMQPYQVLNFCIALTGLFPSRN